MRWPETWVSSCACCVTSVQLLNHLGWMICDTLKCEECWSKRCLCLSPAGQWILQLSEVDSGERSHWAGPEVLYRRGQLRTGVQTWNLYFWQKDIWTLQINCFASLRPTRWTWSPVAQSWWLPTTTRRNILSMFNHFFMEKSAHLF